MDRVEQEVVARRSDYERVLLRAAEAQVRLRANDCERARAGLHDLTRTFEGVQKKVVERFCQHRDPSVALQESKAGMAQLVQARRDLAAAEDRLRLSRSDLMTAAQKHAFHDERAACLERMSTSLQRKCCEARSSREEEALVNAQAAARGIGSSRAERGDAGGPEISQRSESFSPVQPELVSVERAALAISIGSNQTNGIDGSTGHSDTGSAQASVGNSPSSPGSEKANSFTPALRVTAGDYADHIRGLSSWQGEKGSDVAFTFSGESGKSVHVKLARQGPGAVTVAVAPQTLADQRALAGALRSLKHRLEQHGLNVTDMSVGSVNPAIHRNRRGVQK